MSADRVYLVEHDQSKGVRLVRATNKAQALRFVAEPQFLVEVASQDSLIDHVKAGVEVEDATKQTLAGGND